MNTFEELYKKTEHYKHVAGDPLSGHMALVKERYQGSERYAHPFTRMAEAMFNLGYQSAQAGKPLVSQALAKVETVELERKTLALKPPYYFSQLMRGMEVKFKRGGTAIIRDLVVPDDQGQSFYGVKFECDKGSPMALSGGYCYSFGTAPLITGQCDNDEHLDIECVLIPAESLKEVLNLRLIQNTDQQHYREPHPANQQTYVYFGHQRLVDTGKDVYYCRAQFNKRLEREAITLQADTPKELLEALEGKLGTFFGVQEVTVAIHIDIMRGDMQTYRTILQYGLPRLFLGNSGSKY